MIENRHFEKQTGMHPSMIVGVVVDVPAVGEQMMPTIVVVVVVLMKSQDWTMDCTDRVVVRKKFG